MHLEITKRSPGEIRPPLRLNSSARFCSTDLVLLQTKEKRKDSFGPRANLRRCWERDLSGFLRRVLFVREITWEGKTCPWFVWSGRSDLHAADRQVGVRQLVRQNGSRSTTQVRLTCSSRLIYKLLLPSAIVS